METFLKKFVINQKNKYQTQKLSPNVTRKEILKLILNKKAILINKPFPLPNPSNYSWNSKINLTSVGIFWNSSHFEILCGGRDK